MKPSTKEKKTTETETETKTEKKGRSIISSTTTNEQHVG